MYDQVMEPYYSGEKLWGDDYPISEIEKWFKEEAEGYANLGSNNLNTYQYSYHTLNKYHGFSKIPVNTKFDKALGIGSAYGHEFIPIIDKIEKLYILEPSEQLKSEKIGNITPTYSKPDISGILPYPDNTFDLVTCFGTLHHIPNVSSVLGEVLRVLKPGGIFMLREPIVSMGRWDRPRRGLTKNERGIPLKFLDQYFQQNNFTILSRSLCFLLTSFFQKTIGKFLNKPLYEYRWYIGFDATLSQLLNWNVRYHQQKIINKIAPTCIFYVVSKKLSS